MSKLKIFIRPYEIKLANCLNRIVMSHYSKYEVQYGFTTEKLLEGIAVDVVTHIDPVTHKKR